MQWMPADERDREVVLNRFAPTSLGRSLRASPHRHITPSWDTPGRIRVAAAEREGGEDRALGQVADGIGAAVG